MTSAQIRLSFLKFFEEQDHHVVPSSPLVPGDDPTLLFTNAGMNQFKDVFLGQERRNYTRAASSQKCMRVSGKHNDLGNVGPSLRHHTFFEMLGNFSFGDYFKAEAIPFAWQLLTDIWNIPAERLYVTVFGGEAGIPSDKDAYAIWRHLVPSDRIFELGLAENFWSMGDTGPCGRCSEIHYHRGDHLPCQEPRCRGIDCSCDRYVEIWNNVFMEFDRRPDGSLSPLPAPSIDTGMGLERIVAILQGTLSNYDTDLFQPLLDKIGTVTGATYSSQSRGTVERDRNISVRVIADHMRAMTFLIADGVLPSNEWRGYVLRKIMRRAMRHGKKLGATSPFLGEFVDTVVDQMGPAYPELPTNRASIIQVIQQEEERFDTVLTDGLPKLETALAQAAQGSGTIDGGDVFRLYDTYGLPLDFVEDMADDRGILVDRNGFDQALAVQRQTSRADQSFKRSGETNFHYSSDESKNTLQYGDDHFEGYEVTSVEGATIVALFNAAREEVVELNGDGYVVLDRTPFYVESGGQVSDTGRIYTDKSSVTAIVSAMERLTPGGPRVHVVKTCVGKLKTNMAVTADVDAGSRDATRRNHTATHLLHAALRKLLGNHVKQAGSLVAPNRLRFDFSHFDPVTPKQLSDIEIHVNKEIYRNCDVETTVRSRDEAIAAGAMALFGEKYGDRVRVVSVPGVSTELCGGTHCRATGDIGPFVITQESGVAAGVRRIDAMTGKGAVEHIQQRLNILDEVVNLLAVPEDRAAQTIDKIQTTNKNLTRQVDHLKIKAAMAEPGPGSIGSIVEEIAGVKMATRHVTGLEKPALRALADSIRDELTSGIVVLTSEGNGKAILLVSVTKDLTSRVHAGKLVKALAPIIGGRGGGRPDFAEAGGRQTHKIKDLIPQSRDVVSRMLSEKPEGTD